MCIRDEKNCWTNKKDKKDRISLPNTSRANEPPRGDIVDITRKCRENDTSHDPPNEPNKHSHSSKDFTNSFLRNFVVSFFKVDCIDN